jgi:hypothetical protein
MLYNFPCNWQSAFSPISRDRVGYLTDFGGLGLNSPLARDLTVLCPSGLSPKYDRLTQNVRNAQPSMNGIQNSSVSVTGILESVSWEGGVSRAIKFSCYMSEQNATLLKSLQMMTLTTTSIAAIGWWITIFDKVSRRWFEENYPANPTTLSAQLAADYEGPDAPLTISGKSVQPDGIDLDLFNVKLRLVPSGNSAAMIMVASSASSRIMKNWGLTVGTQTSAVLAAVA